MTVASVIVFAVAGIDYEIELTQAGEPIRGWVLWPTRELSQAEMIELLAQK